MNMYRLRRGTTTTSCFFPLVLHRAPLPRLLFQGQPRACMMCCYCCCCCCCRCSSAALVLLLCICGYCPVLLLLLLLLCMEYVFAANPREHGKYASQPLSVMWFRIKAELRTHLLRKLYEYRLVIDIFWRLAEVSCQRSFLMIRTCTLCCWCLLLVLGACCCELAAPTYSPALRTVESTRSTAARLIVLCLSAYGTYSTDAERLARTSWASKMDKPSKGRIS